MRQSMKKSMDILSYYVDSLDTREIVTDEFSDDFDLIQVYFIRPEEIPMKQSVCDFEWKSDGLLVTYKFKVSA